MHDVVHDLILEELRQQKPEVVHSYVNVDIGQSEVRSQIVISVIFKDVQRVSVR